MNNETTKINLLMKRRVMIKKLQFYDESIIMGWGTPKELLTIKIKRDILSDRLKELDTRLKESK